MKNAGIPSHTFNIFPSSPTLHNAAPNWNGKNVIVDSAQFMYVLEGGIVIYIREASYIVPRNHAVYISAGTPHSCWAVPGALPQYLDISFKAIWDDTDFFSTFDLSKYGPVFALPRESMLDFYRASLLYDRDNMPQRLSVCSFLTKFLTLLFSVIRQKDETEAEFGDVIEKMCARISEDITLEELSAMRGVSPSYFSRKFKETAGISPQQFLTQLRLWHAAALLKDRGFSVQNAAAAIGFSDVYYFKNFFKKFFGVAPDAYAKIFIAPNYVNIKR